MNNPFETNFCTEEFDTRIATLNYINYIIAYNNKVGKPIPESELDNLKIVSRGTGFEYVGENNIGIFSLRKLYDFWSDYDNLVRLKNIVVGYGYNTVLSGENNNSNYDLFRVCQTVSAYNKAILKNFFCNIIFTQEEISLFDYPTLGKEQINCALQKQNIYNYLTRLRGIDGIGLSRCVKIDAEPEESVMKTFCSSMIPETVEDQSLFISDNKNIYKWCGCYAEPSNFSKDSGIEQNSCEPLCSNPISIKIYKDVGLENTSSLLEECNQTICAIGQVSLRSTDFKGEINFNQICPGCAEAGNCLCIIDTSVAGVLDKIQTQNGGTQGKINFEQVCPNAFCMKANSEGSYERIQCNTDNPSNTNKDPFLGYSGDGLLRNLSTARNFTQENYIFFIGISAFFILFFIISFISISEINLNRYIFRRKVNKDLKENKGKAGKISLY